MITVALVILFVAGGFASVVFCLTCRYYDDLERGGWDEPKPERPVPPGNEYVYRGRVYDQPPNHTDNAHRLRIPPRPPL